MTNFATLFDTHKTDKGFRHGYGPAYDTLLSGHPVRAVLEIGAYLGASLRAWAEAWPTAEVWGVDIVARTLPEVPRVHVLYGDATRLSFLQCLPQDLRFDLIVDDGSHRIQDQVLAFGVLRDRLAPGGLYVIEDVFSPVHAQALIERLSPDRTAEMIEVDGPEHLSNSRLVVVRAP